MDDLFLDKIERLKGILPLQDVDSDYFKHLIPAAIRYDVEENPALLTPAAVAVLADIITDKALPDPVRTYDPFFVLLGVLTTYAGLPPDKTGQILERLEVIVRDNPEQDMRREATINIAGICRHGGPWKEAAAKALENIASSNGNANIRTLARDWLTAASKEQPDLAPRALLAQLGGVNDAFASARSRALSVLTNRVTEKDCSAGEAESLMEIFTKANNAAQDDASRHWSAVGMADIHVCRLKEMAGRGCTTLHQVTPFKPLRFVR